MERECHWSSPRKRWSRLPTFYWQSALDARIGSPVPLLYFGATERCASGAGSSRSDAGAKAVPRRLQAVYRYTVLLSVIMHTSGRSLSGKAGTCTRGVRIGTPKRMTLSNIASTPQVRWRSSTHTQSLPRHRLSLMPSQSASRPVPSHHSITR